MWVPYSRPQALLLFLGMIPQSTLPLWLHDLPECFPMAGAAGTCLRLGGQGVPGGAGAMASQVPLVTHVIKQFSVCSLVLLRFVYREF